MKIPIELLLYCLDILVYTGEIWHYSYFPATLSTAVRIGIRKHSNYVGKYVPNGNG